MMMVSEWVLIVTVITGTWSSQPRPEVHQIPVQSRAVCEKVGKLVADDFIRAGFVKVSITCAKVVEP